MIKKIQCVLICMLLISLSIPIIAAPVIIKEKNTENEIKEITQSTSYTPGTWLLTTTWGQRNLYSEKTPIDPDTGDHYRLGCWSVAIGQIIRFHELQSQGEVIYVFSDDFLPIVNDMDSHEYDWINMPDELNASSTVEEKDNVSWLLYDTSTVIQKNFGTMGYCLNSSEMIDELIDHFQYISVQTEVVKNPSIYDIIDEIDNHRPCMLYLENIAGTQGHAVAIDGYKWSRDFEVHLNMGWYGDDNGFYEYNKPIDIYDNNSVRTVIFIRLAPNKPQEPIGPNIGIPGMNYNFTTKTTAPNDPIYYKWDWGDGTFTDWLDRYNSNEICEASHAWKEKGTYNIRVKAKDVEGWESDWSESHAVSMPKEKQIFTLLIERIIDYFPIFEKLLRY